MKLLAITSNQLRHKYVINELIKNFDVIAVFAEEKAFHPENAAINDDDKEIIKDHFKMRDLAEIKYFGENTEFNIENDKVFMLQRGEINEPHIVKKMESLAPDGIAVFGSGILKKPIIDICPNKIFNIHLGLSPYYRGSGTNFWPFINEEPEYAGITIHYIDEHVDTGKIIHQDYSIIERKDSFHDIGCKTIIRAAELFVRTFKELENNTLSDGFTQREKGKLFMRKDFNADAVRKMYNLFNEGLIDRYLDELEIGKKKRPKIIS